MKSIAEIIGYGNKTQKYFPTWSSIILEILLSVVALFIFALTAIQIAMRLVICSMKYLLAPYMVASIIDPEDNSFGTWLRSIGGDLISNFCQIYFTYFVLVLCSNSSIQNSLGNDWIGKFAYQTGKSMTASYNDAGGGIDGIKSTGGNLLVAYLEKVSLIQIQTITMKKAFQSIITILTLEKIIKIHQIILRVSILITIM